ncbi:hypothetical protein E2C01_001093 [Portunus trituberculatus]|uniref:Uncharacterized protein n=1 Tax=Portunus trituberculatus TaxID=210409 RepID=A0A5B7CGC0_PORTR|nr:hypothetical protein [Portunus trituberculatus]
MMAARKGVPRGKPLSLVVSGRRGHCKPQHKATVARPVSLKYVTGRGRCGLPVVWVGHPTLSPRGVQTVACTSAGTTCSLLVLVISLVTTHLKHRDRFHYEDDLVLVLY